MPNDARLTPARIAFRPVALAMASSSLFGLSLPLQAQQTYFTQSGSNYTYPVNQLPFSGNPSSLDFTGNTIQIAGNNLPGSFSALAGALLKADGLSIGYGGSGAVGDVTFSGAGTKVELLGGTVNRLDVGSWGTGTLTVSAGALLDATLNAGACTGGCYNYIGNGAGSTATLNITGAGSEVRTLRLFTVGASGVFTNPPTSFTLGVPGGETNAFVNVLDGGRLSTGRATVGNNTGSPSGNGLERANGTVVVDGIGSQWVVARNTIDNQSAQLTIGQNAGATGTVTVSGGGKLSFDNGVNPGGPGQDPGILVGLGGKGTLLITGAGSTLENSSTGGYINVGQTAGSDGSFEVRSGATASSTFLNVGRNAGAKGSMLIDGANSVLTLSGVSTISGQTGTAAGNIGRSGGEGTATVSNGGYWLITDGGQDGRSINGSPALSVGRDNNSKGLLTITGAGSKVDVIGNSLGLAPGVPDNNNPFVNIGRENAGGTTQGELMVSGGGKLVLTGNAVSTPTDGRATTLNIGGRSGFAAKGTATVTGAGSEIIVQGYDAFINVGREAGAVGTLNVLAGGKVSSTSLAVGVNAAGTVNIDNATIALSGYRTDSSAVGAGTTIGRGAGSNGALNMSNGAIFTINPTVINGGMAVGGDQFLTGGTGTVTMSGGSSIIIGGPLSGNVFSVGRTGTGTVELAGGSFIDVGSGGLVDLGRAAGGVGILSLASGSKLKGGDINFGGNGGTVAGGTAIVTVTGAGSEIAASGDVGSVLVGRGGTGTLNVTNEGAITAKNLTIGRISSGTFNADNAVINLSGEQFADGNYFGARLAVGNRGGNGIATINSSTVTIANATASGASLSVGGTAANPLGTGVLNLTGGTTVNINAATGLGELNVGYDGNGTANISGPGTTVNVNNGGAAYVARLPPVPGSPGSTGLLNMSNGAVLNAAFVGIGVGTVGTGNTLGAAGGTATLTLNDSTINTSRFELGVNGLLTGNNGVINVADSVNPVNGLPVKGPVVIGGTVSPGTSPGRLRINCDLTMLSGSKLILEINDSGVSVDIDQLIIGEDSNFNLFATQIIFSFLGSTNPEQVDLNLNRFLRAGTTGSNETTGLQRLFKVGDDWNDVVNSKNFAFQSSVYDVTSFEFNPLTGGIIGVEASAIPEPATYALVLLALGMMRVLSRRSAARRL